MKPKDIMEHTVGVPHRKNKEKGLRLLVIN